MSNLEIIQKKLSDEVAKYNQLQKEYQKVMSIRQQLDEQLTENKIVQTEIELLENDANIFKLVGPVLIKQDLHEAISNVKNRITYITNEITKQEDALKVLEKNQNAQRENISKLQKQMNQTQIKSSKA